MLNYVKKKIGFDFILITSLLTYWMLLCIQSDWNTCYCYEVWAFVILRRPTIDHYSLNHMLFHFIDDICLLSNICINTPVIVFVDIWLVRIFLKPSLDLLVLQCSFIKQLKIRKTSISTNCCISNNYVVLTCTSINQ